MGREIVSWEGGDLLGWWPLREQRYPFRGISMDVETKGPFGWYDEAVRVLLSANGFDLPSQMFAVYAIRTAWAVFGRLVPIVARTRYQRLGGEILERWSGFAVNQILKRLRIVRTQLMPDGSGRAPRPSSNLIVLHPASGLDTQFS